MANLNHLRVFYHAAKCLSFTGAAKDLCITQPAITTQIKSFEDYCGLRLFRRRGRKIYLTDEGSVIYEYARRIFEYERQVENVIEDLKELKRGILRLGTTKTYARYFMPFLITSFRGAYPDIKIHLDEGSSLDMIHSLLDLRNEVAIIAKVQESLDISFTPFSHEELVLVLAPDHQLTEKRSVTVKELAKEPIIMKEMGSGTRKLVNELFEGHGLIPNILMETSNTEFIKQLVQRGDGVSFVVREAVAIEIQDKKLVTRPIEGQKLFLDVSVAHLKNQPLSPAARAFLDILFKIVPKERPDQGIRLIMAKMLANWK